MQSSEPQESTGELEEAEVVLGLFLPADEDAAPAIEPGQGPFNDPATSGESARGRRGRIPGRGDVRQVVAVEGGEVARVVVVAGVEAQVLGPVGEFDRWPLQHDRV